MPQGNLPEGARKIYLAAEASAKKSTCKDSEDRDACTAKVAWSAVKSKYKKVGDKWVRKESDALAQFSMAIVKAPFDNNTGEMKWRSVNSDTDKDSYNDEMSLELFSDFMGYIKTGESPPEQFCSDFWKGGIPYLSVSHYPDLNGDGVPGKVDEIYIDGNKLKSFGTFDDTVLGRACWKSIRKDLLSEERSDADNKVRISIAFLDWQHEHKSDGYIFDRKENPDEMCPECFKELMLSLLEGKEPEGKKFLKGQLIHLAMTRVPVNTRTLMEVDKSMAEEIKTRKDDAASIVGDDEAEKLEELAKDALQSEALVTMSEAEEKGKKKMDEDEEEDDEMEDKKKKKKKEKSEIVSEDSGTEGFSASEGVPGGSENETKLSEILEELKALVRPEEAHISHPLDEAVENLKAVYDEALSVDFTPEESLQLIQEPFTELGNLVRESVTNKPSGEPESAEGSENKELARALSAIADRLEGLEQTQGMIQAQLSSGGAGVPDAVPQRRSYQPPVREVPTELAAKQSATKSSTPKLRELVNKSVGIN